jgi:GTP:adenosylcobinamide-phosphate guanylyltransferase
MDAIVTAGGIPQPGEPLYELTQGKSKALLDVCGKPMIQWVVDALCQAHTIDQILIMGLEADSGLQCAKLADYLPNQGSMLENIRVGVTRVLELNPQATHVLVVSSDIPTITESMVDWVVETTMQTDLDVYYNVITRQVMEARFPGSNRTYTRLKGLEICGGDMNVIRTLLVTANDDLWMRLIAARKSVVKQAAIIGWDTLFLMLLRQIDLDGAVKRVTKRVHLTGKAILCPYAEVGMDVDKPFQLDLVRSDLAKRLAVP